MLFPDMHTQTDRLTATQKNRIEHVTLPRFYGGVIINISVLALSDIMNYTLPSFPFIFFNKYPHHNLICLVL